MALTKEQFIKARDAGFTPEQIASFEQKRTLENKSPVEQKISERGTIGDIFNQLKSQSTGSKIVGGLRAIGVPTQVIEASIANPMLEIQKGTTKPLTPFLPMPMAMASDPIYRKAVMSGITGQRLGEFGDVIRTAGWGEPAAIAVGSTLSYGAPAKILSKVGGVFKGVNKLTDKGILRAGGNLIRGSEDAVKTVGVNVDNAFSTVNHISVDGNRFINEMGKLPKPLINQLETDLGQNLDDIGQVLDIGKLRKIKQLIGDYRPTAFGKEERGVVENIDIKNINKAYAGIKNLMQQTLKDNGLGENAKKLMDAEHSFSEVKRASDYIKKTVVDITLLKPTKAGKMADKMGTLEDVSGREALKTIRNSGKVAKQNVDKAISALEAFNRWRMVTQLSQKATNAVLFGGIAGSIGGKMFRKATEQD